MDKKPENPERPKPIATIPAEDLFPKGKELEKLNEKLREAGRPPSMKSMLEIDRTG